MKEAGQSVKEAGQSVGRAASKGKAPLVAGGAALLGAAGGLAIGSRRAGRGKGMPVLFRRPLVKVSSRDVSHAAKEMGKFGAQMGRLASELESARESGGRGNSRRSPVEVVLDGLTSRR